MPAWLTTAETASWRSNVGIGSSCRNNPHDW